MIHLSMQSFNYALYFQSIRAIILRLNLSFDSEPTIELAYLSLALLGTVYFRIVPSILQELQVMYV